MGREIKRVALDFSAPLDEPWKGYQNPHWKPCPEENRNCFNGWTGAGKWLESVARLIGMLGEHAVEEPRAEALRARGMLWPHPYLDEWAQAPRMDVPRDVMDDLRAIKDDGARMRAIRRYLSENRLALVPFGDELRALVSGLIGEDASRWGFGGPPPYAIAKALQKAAGVVETWGVCQVCGGDAIDPTVKAVYDAWEREEPPAGDGWQLWQTVSDGPISPVFDTADALIDWMCQPAPLSQRTHTDPDPFPSHPWAQGWRREIAESFVKKHGWAPTFVGREGEPLVSGAEAVVRGVGGTT